MAVSDEKYQELNRIIDVLVIDATDDQLISGYLKEYDITFSIALNKKEAIKKLNNFTFELILIDMVSPELEGGKIIQLIKNDLHLNIPIVAIIAEDVEEGLKNDCFNKGINGCFTRPISKIELVGVLTQFLQKEATCLIPIPIVYQTIDLSYLREIGMGDVDFEREMAAKFIEIISDEVSQLMYNLEKEHDEALKQLVHKMRSTVYLMGLQPKLSTALDAVEYDKLSRDQLKKYISLIVEVCHMAKEEALVFMKQST
jgi:CheY-like chemotaxis protein